MESKKISEVSTERLKEHLESLKNEREALDGTISNIENVLFLRDNPELENNQLDFYVQLYN